MVKLSPTKQKVYDFILGFKAEHDGCAPSMIEIAKACGLKSTSTARYHLGGLESLELIRCNYGKGKSKSRMIEIVGAQWTPGPLTISSEGAFYYPPAGLVKAPNVFHPLVVSL
jgi:SOS-response transcriptional repressor LexA